MADRQAAPWEYSEFMPTPALPTAPWDAPPVPEVPGSLVAPQRGPAGAVRKPGVTQAPEPTQDILEPYVKDALKRLYPGASVTEVYRDSAKFKAVFQYSLDSYYADWDEKKRTRLGLPAKPLPRTPVSPQEKVGAAVRGVGGYLGKKVVGGAVGALYDTLKGLGYIGWSLVKYEARAAKAALSSDINEYRRIRSEEGKALREYGAHALGAIAESPMSLVSPVLGEAFREKSLAPITEEPGRLLADIMMQPVKAAPVISAGAIAATKIPALEKRLRPLTRPIIPKSQWTGEMLALEGRREGQYMGESLRLTEPIVKDLLQMKTDPALEFVSPALSLSKAEQARFGKRYKAAQIPGSVDYRPFHYKGKDLELTVDAKGWITYLKADVFNQLPKDIQNRIFRIRNTVDELHTEIFNRGIISPEEWRKNLVSYIHKMYETHYDPRAWTRELKKNRPWVLQDAEDWLVKYRVDPTTGGPATRAQAKDVIQRILADDVGEIMANPERLLAYPGAFTSNATALLKRKQIPAEIEALLGPMSAQRNALKIGHTLDAQIRILANDNAMLAMQTIKAADGRLLLIPRAKRDVPPGPGYVALEDNLAFGRWRGSWIHPDMVDAIPTMRGDSISGPLSRYIQQWKASKTVWNPGTHLNNILGLVMSGHIVGNNPTNPLNARYYAKASKDMSNFVFGDRPEAYARIPMLHEAIDDGVVRPGFAGSELSTISRRLDALKPGGNLFEEILQGMTESKMAQKVKDVYDSEDNFFRYAAYLKHRDKGMSRVEASAEVHKAFQTYSVTSKLGNWLRGRGEGIGGVSGKVGQLLAGPYTSFPLEMMRIYMTAAKEHPFRLMVANTIPLAITINQLSEAGISLDEWHDMQSNFSDRDQGRALIPVHAGEGELNFYDLSYAWPLAAWLQRGELGESIFGIETPRGPADDLFFSGPLWNGIWLWMNYNPWTGGKAIDRARGQGIVEFLQNVGTAGPTPPWLLNLGRRGMQSLYEVSPRRGVEPETGAESVLYSLFPQLEPRTERELWLRRKAERGGELGEIKRGARGVRRDPTLLPHEKERKLESIREEKKRRKVD